MHADIPVCIEYNMSVSSVLRSVSSMWCGSSSPNFLTASLDYSEIAGRGTYSSNALASFTFPAKYGAPPLSGWFASMRRLCASLSRVDVIGSLVNQL